MPVDDAALSASLTRALGGPVTILSRRPLGGGSISDTERIDTSAGSVVVKSHPTAPAGLFASEAAGLDALRAAAPRLTLPRVIVADDGPVPFLVIEYIKPAARTPAFDDTLGRGLAELHQATSPRFGFDRDTFCGTTRQPNAWIDRWVEFYASARLRCQVRAGRNAGWLDRDDTTRLGRLVDHLDRWIAEPPSGPSLIHGDLWSGNLQVAEHGGPALIDPAVSYSHREAELGMMTLFGGFSSRVFAAYDEVFPLEAGWRDRNPLYQLYHLLNHLNLFGAGYHTQVMAIVRRFA
jgi:protein-ribulosamine 3-kinase